MTHPAVVHIKRLQEENRFLRECILAERKLRIKEYRRYRWRTKNLFYSILWSYVEAMEDLARKKRC